MIVNLLDIARSEEGGLVIHPAEVEVPRLLGDLYEEMHRRATEAGKTLVMTSEAGPSTILADPDLLRRVLENLLDNALKYTHSGSCIQVVVTASAGAVELRIEDDGPGVPPAYRERIFQKYVRAPGEDGAALRTSRGLGLLFCRLAVEAHGGRIWVEDRVPNGSAFCVRLPTLPGDALAARRPEQVRSAAGPLRGARSSRSPG
jgi:signal transduction histidine kinase